MASPYVYNSESGKWEYLSSKRRVWKIDWNNRKFQKFLKESVWPVIKSVSSEVASQVTFIKNLVILFTNHSSRMELLKQVLKILLPLLTTVVTPLLITFS